MKTTYPAGTLIHYVDYTYSEPQHYIGVLLRIEPMIGCYTVLCEGQVTNWFVFMCEVVS